MQKQTAVPTERLEPILEVRFVRPATLQVEFADQGFSLSIESLDMPADRIRWETVAATASGDGITMLASKGDLITIDAAAIRYLVDPVFAAAIDAMLKAVQPTRDELKTLARDCPPPSEWYDEPEKDLRLESWK